VSGSDHVRFDGRIAIVTGAGRGLGRAHAVLLGARGATVVVNDLASEPSASNAAETADLIRSAGGSASVETADIATSTGARSLVDRSIGRYGRVDILINNAGLLRSCDFADLDEALFDEVLAANLRSTYLVTRAAWAPMCAAGYGRIVSTTSNSGLLGTAGSVAYAAAKAGIWGLTRSLALEGEGRGILVNAIAPIAYTAMSAGSRLAPPSWRTGEGDDWADRLDPSAVAPVAAWLAHESCTVSGQVLSAAGGRVARFGMGLTDGFVDDPLTIEAVRDQHAGLSADDRLVELPRAADESRLLRRRLMGSRPVVDASRKT
jgi:NAD(P)-dependent dehydrogenase (short-subunit alcohol dehydrogenase family)